MQKASIARNTILLFTVGLGLWSALGSYVAAQAPSAEQASAEQAAEAALAKLLDDYHEQYLIMFPLEATSFGDSRYNDQLPIHISPDFIAKERQFYSRTLERLALIDTQQLGSTSKLMAQVLTYEMQRRLERLEFNFERIPFHQFDGLPLTFAQLGSGASSQPFETVKDYDDWLKRAGVFPAWCNAAIERFREGIREGYVLPRVLVQKMIDQMLDESLVPEDATQSLFYDPVKNFPASFNDQQRNRLQAAYLQCVEQEIMPAYRRLGEFLREEYLPHARQSAGIWALNGGREQYQYWVRYWTTTDMTPDEIFELGQSEVQRITAEMEQVKQQMGFSGTLADFFEHLRTDPQFKPFSTPEEVLDFFRGVQAKLAPALAQAFKNTPRTPFEIRRTESFREKTASAEYMPGSADGARPGIFYCPIPDAKQFNITGGMESLFLHEALPGHHYQISLQQENEQLPQFAKLLWYGAYGEGWGLYCESIGEELGLYTDPRQRIGALGDEMHRAIRLVVDVGMHWKGWTRERALQYMLEHEPIAEDGAVAEIERYMAFTAQALSYKIGQLKIQQLRRDCERKLGDKFSLPDFHDQVLRHGCLPLSILEKQLSAWTAGLLANKPAEISVNDQAQTPEPRMHKDITYATVNGHELKLDLTLPQNVQRPKLLVWIHGGGWRGGSRAKPPIRRAVDEGFALASISYRFSDVAIFPAQLHDCKAAVRWLRAHADHYGFDAEHIGVAGSSAGGTLALLMGTTADVVELEGDVGGNLNYSSRVQAVVDYFGPSDFVLRGQTQPEMAYSEEAGSFALLGGKKFGAVDKELELAASAVQYVTNDDPPLLVLHGTADQRVLPDQSQRIVEAYHELGNSAQLIMVEGAGHSGIKFFTPELLATVVNFFKQSL